jgi:hypothetical protein
MAPWRPCESHVQNENRYIVELPEQYEDTLNMNLEKVLSFLLYITYEWYPKDAREHNYLQTVFNGLYNPNHAIII